VTWNDSLIIYSCVVSWITEKKVADLSHMLKIKKCTKSYILEFVFNGCCSQKLKILKLHQNAYSYHIILLERRTEVDSVAATRLKCQYNYHVINGTWNLFDGHFHVYL